MLAGRAPGFEPACLLCSGLQSDETADEPALRWLGDALKPGPAYLESAPEPSQAA